MKRSANALWEGTIFPSTMTDRLLRWRGDSQQASDELRDVRSQLAG